MSVSKLETLPNEILINIFEEYINGVDILIAFAYTQNQRFDAIISQCRRFYFNFYNCRKDHFRFCIGLLPAYIEKIDELILSEQNTPGQIYSFLSFFPSFCAFKRLRKLYFDINAEAINWLAVQDALLSLSTISIDKVFIKIIKASKIPTLNHIVGNMFHLKTIKKLYLISDFQRNKWNFLADNASNIEYLTIFGISCTFEDLQSIFQCATHLKYLNVSLTENLVYELYYSSNHPQNNIISIPTLHTLILSFQESDLTTFDMLAQYLKAMPALRHLEIKAHSMLIDANAWQDLLQTSLPLLTHFCLQTTVARIEEMNIEKILPSFETPFWLSKKNFHIIITKHQHIPLNKFQIDNMQIDDQDEFNQPVIQWWIAPMRTHIDNISTNKINKLGIFNMANSLSQYYYFKNIKYLVIYKLDIDCLQWLITYTNYLEIKHLDVSLFYNDINIITSLLSYVKNIISLRIHYNCLLDYRNKCLHKNTCLKYLDISVDIHNFENEDIIIISSLFPNIEHLVINTNKLSNIPLVNTYLPYLNSLTFKIIDSKFPTYNIYKQNLWDNNLREKVQFLFQREKNWMTIWIDHNALEEPYWQTSTSNLFESDNKSMTNTSLKRRFPRIE